MFGRFRPVHYLNHAWATKIAHGERLRGPVSRGIAKCHNPAHPGLDLVIFRNRMALARRTIVELYNETAPSHNPLVRDWRALALTQVHHGSRLSDSREDGEALSSVHSTALAAGKLIHNLLRDGRVKND